MREKNVDWTDFRIALKKILYYYSIPTLNTTSGGVGHRHGCLAFGSALLGFSTPHATATYLE